MTYLDRFLDSLTLLPGTVIYVVLGISAFVENVFPPIPGDTITAFGAFLVGTGRLHFFGVYLSTTLGSVAGFVFLFWVGRIVGRRFFIERDYWLFKAEDIIRAEAWYKKYGYFLVLLNRFFPGIRSVISVAGGITGLRLLKVTLYALLSASVWNLVWISLGYVLGRNWETVRENLGQIMARYNLAIFSALGVVVLILLVKRLKRKQR